MLRTTGQAVRVQNRKDNACRRASSRAQTVCGWRRPVGGPLRRWRHGVTQEREDVSKRPSSINFSRSETAESFAQADQANAYRHQRAHSFTQLRSPVSNPATTIVPANVPRKNVRREISPVISSLPYVEVCLD